MTINWEGGFQYGGACTADGLAEASAAFPGLPGVPHWQRKRYSTWAWTMSAILPGASPPGRPQPWPSNPWRPKHPDARARDERTLTPAVDNRTFT